MRRSILIRCVIVVVAGGVAAIACTRAATPFDVSGAATRPTSRNDVSDVRWALKAARVWALTRAVFPLDECAYGQDDDGRRFIQAASDYTKAQRALVEPIKARFGDAGLDGLRLRFPTQAEAQSRLQSAGFRDFIEVDALAITVHGDDASARAPDPSGRAATLKRVSGVWKLAFDTDGFAADRGWSRDKLRLTTAAYAKTARDLETLGKDIAVGKFKTVDEAVAAGQNIERQVYPNW